MEIPFDLLICTCTTITRVNYYASNQAAPLVNFSLRFYGKPRIVIVNNTRHAKQQMQ
jgi:hypothetical protein